MNAYRNLESHWHRVTWDKVVASQCAFTPLVRSRWCIQHLVISHIAVGITVFVLDTAPLTSNIHRLNDSRKPWIVVVAAIRWILRHNKVAHLQNVHLF